MAKRKASAARNRVRGSELLAGRRVTASELQQLVSLGQKQGIRLVHWSIYGQPAPDGVSGAFQVKPELAGSVLAALMKMRGVGVDVFPYGIPVPKDMVIRFNSRTIG